MRIAVNTRFFVKEQVENCGTFTKELLFRIAEQHPDDQFIFFFDRPYDSALKFPVNVAPVILSPKVSNLLTIRWWFDVKVPIALKKYKADLFISPHGVCSLTTRIPQVMMVNDLAFLHYPKFYSKFSLFFYRTHTPKFFRKTKVVATSSEFLKQQIGEKYNLPPDKIMKVSSAARDIFKPIDYETKEQVKEKYAGGCEYFVFVGGMHPQDNLLNLLKAFSLFKKRQHTNMKLLIVGDCGKEHKDTIEKLETYKFRDAVKLLDQLLEQEYVQIIAGAYALVLPGFFDGFSVALLEAMQCNVPVIAAGTGSILEIGEDAVLYFDPNDPSAIADQMKLIFKDENLRSKLIEKGKTVAAQYSWDKSAHMMWTAIEQAVSK